MARVILHARHALDHQGDARQGPETGPEPMRAGALAQGRVDAGQTAPAPGVACGPLGRRRAAPRDRQPATLDTSASRSGG